MPNPKTGSRRTPAVPVIQNVIEPAAFATETAAPPAAEAATAAVEAASEQARNLAEDVFSVAKPAIETVQETTEAAAEQITAATEQAGAALRDASADGAEDLRELGLKSLEAMRANAEAAFDHSVRLMSARSLAEVIELQSGFVRRQFETMGEQARQLTALAQRSAAQSVRPLQQLAKGFGLPR